MTIHEVARANGQHAVDETYNNYLRDELAKVVEPLMDERNTARAEVTRLSRVLEETAGALTLARGRIAELEAQLPKPEPEPARGPVLGTSYEASASRYAEEVDLLDFAAKFVYWPGGEAHVYDNGLASIPRSHDAYLSIARDDGRLRDVFEEWELNHTGTLYPMAQQEPEDNMTDLQWQGLARAVSAAAEGLDRVIPCLEFTAYAIHDGTLDRYYRPDLGIEHASFSCYALLRADGTPKVDPVAQINQCADWASKRGLTWGVAAAGYPLTAARRADPAHVKRRLDWVRAHHAQAAARGASHYLWFNTSDYSIERDPDFHEVWRTLTA